MLRRTFARGSGVFLSWMSFVGHVLEDKCGYAFRVIRGFVPE